ncbi:SPOR domain-containing protein [Noviherbaspirillum massiliense]|uniref:SPOR domain-containing protein n=1 Tax=Noviherbaspirillum massiliense TaxID=1465823 RepID=UPI00030EA0F1|nr:SPOR domain-containing protein [Noviherbaspirillum massiliense]
MLKLLFWLLLLANAVLLAFQQGYLEAWIPSGHEPARMNNQFNADKIRQIPADAASKLVAPPATPKVAEQKPLEKPPILACAEIGNFTADDAKRFEAQVAAVSDSLKLSQRSVQEAATHIVYMPSQGSKAGAEKKAEELRRLGIKDFYIIQDNSDLRWGISLGVFRHEEAARAQLASLAQKGVRSARIGERTVAVKTVAFQVRDLEPAAREALEKIKADFPKQEIRNCEAA